MTIHNIFAMSRVVLQIRTDSDRIGLEKLVLKLSRAATLDDFSGGIGPDHSIQTSLDGIEPNLANSQIWDEDISSHNHP
jgi:hypothetical protein